MHTYPTSTGTRQHMRVRTRTRTRTGNPPTHEQEVDAALLEAADNVRFRASLRPQLEKLGMMDDFVALVGMPPASRRL